MKKLYYISALMLFTVQSAVAQDPVFSQFYTSSLYLNPALAGLEKDVVLGMNYRSQWGGVNLPFKTFQFSAIHPIMQRGVRSKHLGGFGATLFSDEAGPNREVISQGLSIASSYNFHLDRSGNHLIATALQFGVLQRQINMDGLQWSSQYSSVMGYDPSLPGESLISEQVTSPVIHAGLMWRLVIDNRLEPVKMFYQGFAASNLNRPQGFYMEEKDAPSVLYKLHGGYMHSFSNGFEVSPNYLIQYQKQTQINIGAYGAYSLPTVTSRNVMDLKVSLGMWYRLDDSVIVTSGLSTAKWNVGFSYDANSSSLERYFQGANAFEVSFMYRISVMKHAKRFSTPLI
jgi:type IX secretion system PorP/SprF family membrane protein